MVSFLRRLAVTVALLLTVAGNAHAAGGHYVFDGGTRTEQAQVGKALKASSFNWSVVPQTITIHISPNIASEATPGDIWLDAHLLDAGTFSWGVVQHEYAHQVDFFLLDGTSRTTLTAVLGGKAWWASSIPAASAPNGTTAHGDLTAERFASTLAWSYWQSPANVMKPASSTDESAAAPPAVFKALLTRVLAGSSK